MSSKLYLNCRLYASLRCCSWLIEKRMYNSEVSPKCHWVREHYGTATLIPVRTKDQTADIFTKSLTGQDFMVHRERSLGEVRKDWRP